MKILFIYKYLTLGGVETQLRTRLEVLNIKGDEASAWFLQDSGGRGIFTGWEENILVGAKACSKEELSEFDVISIIDTPEIIPLLHELPTSVKIIFESHSTYFDNLRYLKSREFRQLRTSRIFVPSNYQKQMVIRFGVLRDLVRVVPNILGRQFFYPAEILPRAEKPLVLWVGRLDDQKNWKGFLDLVKVAKNRSVQFHAMMIGPISFNLDIVNYVFKEFKKRSIIDKISWYPTLPYENMPRLYDLVQVSGGLVISTARNESFGLSIAEGMARGCVALAPNEGPFLEYLVSGSNGFVYDRHDLNTTVLLIQKVLENHELQDQIQKKAKVSIERLFHPAIAGKILYNELDAVQNR